VSNIWLLIIQDFLHQFFQCPFIVLLYYTKGSFKSNFYSGTSTEDVMNYLSFGRLFYKIMAIGINTALFLFVFSSNGQSQDPNFHIYLCFGQSNMCGAGVIEAQDKTVDSRFQFMYPMVGCNDSKHTFGTWYPAVPPLWGCNSGGLGPVDYFGRTMVKNLPTTIKVGVIVVAVPGCDIRLFDKTGYKTYDSYNTVPAKYSGSGYAWLMELAKLAAKDGVIKGFLLHQGETMPDAAKWPGQVKNVYDSLIADLKLPANTPLLAGEVLYPTTGGKGSQNATIDKLPNTIPNSYVISAEGFTGKDQWHFVSASLRTFGERYATKMLELQKTEINNDHMTRDPAQMQPFTCTNNVIKINLKGDFSYRLAHLNGTMIEAGNGTDALSTDVNLSPGVYLLTIKSKTAQYTGKLFRR
jgi:hypothetical protein